MSITEPIPVRTLLGARGFESSLTCLRSLVQYSADPVRLIVHEDGTLTDQHSEKLLSLAPSVELVSRSRADSIVLPQLNRYPRCQAARAMGPLFLKLFDISLMSEGNLIYSDSDVYFLRRFTGVFRPASEEYVFMTDSFNAYSVRPWKIWPFSRIKIGGRVNTGFIVGPSGIDLDYIEWILDNLVTDTAFVRRPYWAEQTCWAAIAAQQGFRLFNPNQIVIANSTMSGYKPETVAIHFVSTYRDRLLRFLDKQQSLDAPVCDVGTIRGRRVTAAGLFLTDFRRRLRRKLSSSRMECQ